MASQVTGRAEVDLPSRQTGKLAFHGHDIEARHMARFEFDQDIDIAVPAETMAEDRAEKRQFPDMIPAAEFGYFCFGDLKTLFYW
jgi:hypothetical protein